MDWKNTLSSHNEIALRGNIEYADYLVDRLSFEIRRDVAEHVPSLVAEMVSRWMCDSLKVTKPTETLSMTHPLLDKFHPADVVHVLNKEMSKYIYSRLLVDNFGEISGVEIELVP